MIYNNPADEVSHLVILKGSMSDNIGRGGKTFRIWQIKEIQPVILDVFMLKRTKCKSMKSKGTMQLRNPIHKVSFYLIHFHPVHKEKIVRIYPLKLWCYTPIYWMIWAFSIVNCGSSATQAGLVPQRLG